MNLRGSIDNQPFDDRNLPSHWKDPTNSSKMKKKRKGVETNGRRREARKNERNYIRFVSTLEEKQQTLRNNRLYDEINYYFNEYET